MAIVMPAVVSISTQRRVTRDAPADDPLVELLDRCGRGERAAMTEFYALTSSRIYAMVCSLTPSAEQAHEAMVITYLNVWRRSVALETRRLTPLAWLGSLAVEAARQTRSSAA